jgi:hypothetical protein
MRKEKPKKVAAKGGTAVDGYIGARMLERRLT